MNPLTQVVDDQDLELAEIEARVPVSVPPAAAFAAITDWPSQSRWMLGTRVWVSRGTGREVGDGLSGFTGLGRLGFLDTMTITEFTDELVVVEHTGRVVRGIGWMGVQSADDARGAVFVWGEAVELPLGILGRAGWAVLVKPMLAAAVRYSLRTLGRQLVASGLATARR